MNRHNFIKLFAVLFLCTSPYTLAADHCVRAHGGNNGDGTTWAAAAGAGQAGAFTSLPAALTRGDTYYIADGDYGGHIFDDAVDGTTYITVKKAIESDHGTETGWSSAYGDGQAVFTFNDIAAAGYFQQMNRWEFSTAYWKIDGQVGGGPDNWDSGHGFKLVVGAAMEDNDVNGYRGVILLGQGASANYDSDYIELRHIEITAPFRSDRDIGVADENEEYAIYAHVSTGEGDSNQGTQYITISECYIHDIYQFITAYYSSNWTVEYSYFARNDTDTPTGNQGAGWFDFGSDDHTIRYNVFEDIAGTANIDMKKNDADDNTGWEIYGNVFLNSALINGTGGNGVIGTTSEAGAWDTSGMRIYNNTFININALATSNGNNAGIFFFTDGDSTVSDNLVKNNIWYNCVSRVDTNPWFTGITANDYNWFYLCERPENTNFDSTLVADETNGQLGAANPFTDWENMDFSLTSNTEAGVDLGSPYDTDMFGNTRTTWSRGALEFISTVGRYGGAGRNYRRSRY